MKAKSKFSLKKMFLFLFVLKLLRVDLNHTIGYIVDYTNKKMLKNYSLFNLV